MKVIGSQFVKLGQVGDFAWMIRRPEYADALFIFNDNEEQFKAYQNNSKSGFGCQDGGGNAVIRHYRCLDPPRAAGIPTGPLSQGGYPELTNEVQNVIDEALAVIKKLLASGRYKRVFYNAANAQGDLGHGIFNPGSDVKNYIVAELRKLGD